MEAEKHAAETDLPLVTIVAPMRNEERYIGACIESVLGQDYPTRSDGDDHRRRA
jgi:glycosyltransferase involved in cell wall biosynthesis